MCTSRSCNLCIGTSFHMFMHTSCINAADQPHEVSTPANNKQVYHLCGEPHILHVIDHTCCSLTACPAHVLPVLLHTCRQYRC